MKLNDPQPKSLLDCAPLSGAGQLNSEAAARLR
jgi:hypothetical protein